MDSAETGQIGSVESGHAVRGAASGQQQEGGGGRPTARKVAGVRGCVVVRGGIAGREGVADRLSRAAVLLTFLMEVVDGHSRGAALHTSDAGCAADDVEGPRRRSDN
ncbi:hypothetical protein [Streptomyces sp. NBC_01462]|uniref:hypothetical protein n=1 Tax=Streptomyces sp. NBC_01462 TaxID=2903876 RepID=UPI002E34DCEE|nr:hypothetical protein [Streptomyces sp. NBC_01462]